MANTTANRIAAEARQACFDLGLAPSLPSVKRILKTGKTSLRNMKNYYLRKDVNEISDKPYTNEFGQQEAFGSICERNLEYAESFVQKNMAKFEGGVNNMTEASFYIMRIQREQINKLSGN